jgi:RNA polymerase sigma-70 factor, ECF subfamily
VRFLRLTPSSSSEAANPALNPTRVPPSPKALRAPVSDPAATEPHAPLTLETVYDAYAPFVWRSLQRMGVPEGELEDAMQELFIVVHRKLPTYQESKAKLSTWMFGIGVNIARRHRAKARRRFFLTEPDLEVSPRMDQEAELAQKQESQLMNDLLSRMRPEHAATFVMFELEGMSCTEIADLTGVPVGTVYSRLHSARDQFRTLLVKHTARSNHPTLTGGAP